MKKIVVGITGASGAMMGERFVRHLVEAGHDVSVILSLHAVEVFREERDIDLGKNHAEIRANFLKIYGNPKNLNVAPAEDMADRISSGSSKIDAMVVVPCSLSSVASIAHGITSNLIHRVASVSIKERRPLILVPRESPLSPIHLKNLLYLSEIGVHIVPATTAFYHKPKTVEEMVDFTLGRVLDLLKIEHSLFKRWREAAE